MRAISSSHRVILSLAILPIVSRVQCLACQLIREPAAAVSRNRRVAGYAPVTWQSHKPVARR